MHSSCIIVGMEGRERERCVCVCFRLTSCTRQRCPGMSNSSVRTQTSLTIEDIKMSSSAFDKACAVSNDHRCWKLGYFRDWKNGGKKDPKIWIYTKIVAHLQVRVRLRYDVHGDLVGMGLFWIERTRRLGGFKNVGSRGEKKATAAGGHLAAEQSTQVRSTTDQ